MILRQYENMSATHFRAYWYDRNLIVVLWSRVLVLTFGV